MRADAGEATSSDLGNARRVELRTANTELLHIDLRISRLETVLRQLLGESADSPTIHRVERRRATC